MRYHNVTLKNAGEVELTDISLRVTAISDGSMPLGVGYPEDVTMYHSEGSDDYTLTLDRLAVGETRVITFNQYEDHENMVLKVTHIVTTPEDTDDTGDILMSSLTFHA